MRTREEEKGVLAGGEGRAGWDGMGEWGTIRGRKSFAGEGGHRVLFTLNSFNSS